MGIKAAKEIYDLSKNSRFISSQHVTNITDTLEKDLLKCEM